MKTTTALLMMLAMAGFFGCEEEFPPYEEPKNVLAGEVSVDAPDTVEGAYDQMSKQYFLNTPIILKAKLTNTYDNLLQGAALVDGTITIQSFCAVPRVCLVKLTTGDMRKPPVFQGAIALGPGTSADFSVIWLPIATDNKYVFEDIPYTLVGNDRFYSPITFIAVADVQIFERVQPIRFGNLEFTVVFKISE
jgi:hypothetical protein